MDKNKAETKHKLNFDRRVKENRSEYDNNNGYTLLHILKIQI